MNDVLTAFANYFSKAHPIAQAAILLFLLAAILLSWLLTFRGRWHHQKTREERDRFLLELQEAKTKLVQAKEKYDRLERKQKARLADFEAQRTQDIQQLETQLGSVRKQANDYQSKLRQAIPAIQNVTRHNDALLAQVQQAESRRDRLQEEVSALLQRFDDLQKIDADIWTTQAIDAGKPPAFVARDRRRARFVTFLNLKGGVGKTTIVANLAAAFATGVLGEKKRVLALDLDYQGTLSNRCVDRKVLEDRRATRRTADRLIDSSHEADPAEIIRELLVPVGGTAETASIIVADEHLDHVDFRKQALFAIECTEVRFEHRRLLHHPAVAEQFDFVFFDCPPRLTTSSINALAASDWIVVPTGLDPNDVEAVPRSLRWFEKLRTQANIDFHAQLAGILLNGTFRSTVDAPAAYEAPNLAQLTKLLERFVLSPESIILKNTIKDDSNISRAAAGEPFGASAKGRERYGAVAAELYQRIKN